MKALCVVVAAFFLALRGQLGEEIQVDGDDFVSHKISAVPVLDMARDNRLLLDFRTVHPNGLLVYVGSDDEREDFLLLDMVHGKLRVTVNLGDNWGGKPDGNLVIGGNWANNWWHTVKLTLKEQHLNVTIRKKQWYTKLPSKNTRLDVDDFVFVGGVNPSIYDRLRNYRPTPNFKGCLRDVFFNGRKILVGGANVIRNYNVHGSPGNICPNIRFDVLSFQPPDSFLMFFARNYDHVSVQMSFRTYVADGVLAYKGYTHARLFGVLLSAGKIVLKVQVSSSRQMIQFSSGEDMNDGEWHHVSAALTTREMRLKVDDLPELVHSNPELEDGGNIHDYLFIGSSPDFRFFDGCIHDLRINNKQIDLSRLAVGEWHGRVFDRCNISSRCFPNPCSSGGKCSQLKAGDFSCNCDGTFHRGPLCQQPVALGTCQEYKNLGLVEDAYCKVDPDGNGTGNAFTVLCNMTSGVQAKTVVTHNKQEPQSVTSNARERFGDIYVHTIKYSADAHLIRSLIARSKWCRQLLSFSCYGAKLLRGRNRVGWLGAGGDNLRTHHWAGAPAGSGKCACGVNRTCANPRLFCNCDVGDRKWREDRGYVTNKADLPVRYFQYKYLSGKAYLTVGPLECFGTRRSSAKHSDVARRATHSIHAICSVVNPAIRPSTAPPVRTDKIAVPLELDFCHNATVPTPTAITGRTLSVAGKSATVPRTIQQVISSSQRSRAQDVSGPGKVTLRTTINQSYPPTSISARKPEEDIKPGNGRKQPKNSLNRENNQSSVTPRSDLITSYTALPTRKIQSTHNSSVGNGSRTFNDTSERRNNQSSTDQDEVKDDTRETKAPWLLFVVVLLLVCVVLMFAVVTVYICKNPEERLFFVKGRCFFSSKKTHIPDEHGFPQPRLRSRSGELDLSHVRQSIDAGAYSVRTGVVIYQKEENKV